MSLSTVYLKNVTGQVITIYLGNPTETVPIIKTLKPNEMLTSATDSWEDFIVQPLLDSNILTKFTLLNGYAPIITLNIPTVAYLHDTLTIEAIGTPILSYQWYFNSTAISLNATSNTYTINLNISGQYYCIVTNDYGSATSNICVYTAAL